MPGSARRPNSGTAVPPPPFLQVIGAYVLVGFTSALKKSDSEADHVPSSSAARPLLREDVGPPRERYSLLMSVFFLSRCPGSALRNTGHQRHPGCRTCLRKRARRTPTWVESKRLVMRLSAKDSSNEGSRLAEPSRSHRSLTTTIFVIRCRLGRPCTRSIAEASAALLGSSVRARPDVRGKLGTGIADPVRGANYQPRLLLRLLESLYGSMGVTSAYATAPEILDYAAQKEKKARRPINWTFQPRHRFNNACRGGGVSRRPKHVLGIPVAGADAITVGGVSFRTQVGCLSAR